VCVGVLFSPPPFLPSLSPSSLHYPSSSRQRAGGTEAPPTPGTAGDQADRPCRDTGQEAPRTGAEGGEEGERKGRKPEGSWGRCGAWARTRRQDLGRSEEAGAGEGQGHDNHHDCGGREALSEIILFPARGFFTSSFPFLSVLSLSPSRRCLYLSPLLCIFFSWLRPRSIADPRVGSVLVFPRVLLTLS